MPGICLALNRILKRMDNNTIRLTSLIIIGSLEVSLLRTQTVAWLSEKKVIL